MHKDKFSFFFLLLAYKTNNQTHQKNTEKLKEMMAPNNQSKQKCPIEHLFETSNKEMYQKKGPSPTIAKPAQKPQNSNSKTEAPQKPHFNGQNADNKNKQFGPGGSAHVGVKAPPSYNAAQNNNAPQQRQQHPMQQQQPMQQRRPMPQQRRPMPQQQHPLQQQPMPQRGPMQQPPPNGANPAVQFAFYFPNQGNMPTPTPPPPPQPMQQQLYPPLYPEPPPQYQPPPYQPSRHAYEEKPSPAFMHQPKPSAPPRQDSYFNKPKTQEKKNKKDAECIIG